MDRPIDAVASSSFNGQATLKSPNPHPKPPLKGLFSFLISDYKSLKPLSNPPKLGLTRIRLIYSS
ncbi:hypothetical protein COLO4_29939 [Corchorus olitorius]|uniref:Uncharacterized protein n=1 Tax=Corchorus olitorius TaxID=93759 RepID=A0A1R3HCP8_9ROSI|nr:hypothetical protein COLO4_29939 [Corchorus olitorius]